MANKMLLDILLSGVSEWNNWRRDNSQATLDFTHADLRNKDLSGVRLDNADLSGANLVGANLSLSNLAYANLTNCKLISTNFQGAQLMGANLSSSILNGADFRNAFLSDAKVSGSSLYSVKYNRWAVYKGINLSGSYGSQLFIRFANDQAFIEEIRAFSAPRPFILAEGKGHYLKQCIAYIKSFPSIRKQNPTEFTSWFIYLLWSITSDCGRSFTLWLFWSLFFAIFFGSVYANYPPPSWLPEQLANLFTNISPSIEIKGGRSVTGFTPYYFSIVTFTTLGFGDVLPKNLAGEIWITLEVILGYIMLGGLISIFATKVARRAN